MFAVKVGGKNYWLFNVMDSDTRFLRSAYLSPTRTTRAAAAALAMARQRSNNPPGQLKTDGLASYRDAAPRALPTHPVKPGVSKGIKAQINNNLSERLQGTIRDRDKTLRGLKARETGQAYVDGLVTHYNYFSHHASLDGKRPAEAAGAVGVSGYGDEWDMLGWRRVERPGLRRAHTGGRQTGWRFNG